MCQLLKLSPILMLLLFVTACDVESNTRNETTNLGHSPQPIVTGTQTFGGLQLWAKPYNNSNGSNSAININTGSYIEVYEEFIVVTNPETQVAHISPHGYYSGLEIKRDEAVGP